MTSGRVSLRLKLTVIYLRACTMTRWSIAQTALGGCVLIIVPLLRIFSFISISMPEKQALKFPIKRFNKNNCWEPPVIIECLCWAYSRCFTYKTTLTFNCHENVLKSE